MPKITLIAETNCVLSGVLGAIDTFSIANFAGAAEQENRSWFDTQIASVTGKPVTGFGDIQIIPHISVKKVEYTDIIFIPGFIPIFDSKEKGYGELIEWLKHHYDKGTLICSICTGAFLLAETGLLDRKTATTNWQFAGLFRQSYPKVNLEIHRLIVEDTGLITTGAATAYLDLCLFIIEKFGSVEQSTSCSKAMLIDPNRKTQSPYIVFNFQKKHGDKEILEAQVWMEKHYSEVVLIDEIARNFGMSPRNFKRRFKRATSDTPINYLQRIRIESAKRQLETTKNSVDEITIAVGYEDSNSFRKLFKKHTTLPPNLYRKKFSRQTYALN